MFETVVSDLRHAVRALWKTPAFAGVSVLVIALGSGGVSTIFSAMNATLLRPLPGAASPERLVEIDRTQADGGGSLSASYPYYEAMRDGARTLEDVAAWGNATLSLGADGETVAARGVITSGNYFDVLGVRPALGRFFQPDEGQSPLADPVLVVSHDYWRTRLGADAAAVGSTLTVNGRAFTLIGVAPPGFRGVYTPLRTDAWVPLTMQPLVRPGRPLADPEEAWLRVFGRLADGVSPEASRAELAKLTAAFATDARESDDFRVFSGAKVTPMTGLPQDAHRTALGFMGLLLGASVLVLMIASVNVGGMLSARALGRSREMAVRAALGAPRGRLIRQMLTETLLLFVLGALAGLVLTLIGTRALERLPLPGAVPFALDFAPDLRVLGFALVLALCAGVVFGTAPALRAARREITSRLRDGSQASGTRRTLLGNALVTAQLALSLVLLVAAGLFLRALDRGQQMDPGFTVAGVATASFNTTSWGYDEDRARAFYRTLRERVEAVPGVTAVSAAGFLPLAFGSSGDEIVLGGRELPIQFATVEHGYFEVLELPIVRGRAFLASDDERAPPVAVINETLARRAWPDGDAIGNTFTFRDRTVRVVGVARDARYASLTESTPAYAYFPLAQVWSGARNLLVRTAGEPLQLGPTLTRMVAELDPAVPPPSVTSLEHETSIVLLPQRIAASVTAVLGGLGLVLAIVGLYGTVAYAATRRTREIGIRVALGAHRSDVLRMIVRQGLGLAGAGVVIGLLLAAAATRLMSGLLFGVSPLDAVTFAGVAALFLLIALGASFIPANRAARTDPMLVLRRE